MAHASKLAFLDLSDIATILAALSASSPSLSKDDQGKCSIVASKLQGAVAGVVQIVDQDLDTGFTSGSEVSPQPPSLPLNPSPLVSSSSPPPAFQTLSSFGQESISSDTGLAPFTMEDMFDFNAASAPGPSAMDSFYLFSTSPSMLDSSIHHTFEVPGHHLPASPFSLDDTHSQSVYHGAQDAQDAQAAGSRDSSGGIGEWLGLRPGQIGTLKDFGLRQRIPGGGGEGGGGGGYWDPICGRGGTLRNSGVARRPALPWTTADASATQVQAIVEDAQHDSNAGRSQPITPPVTRRQRPCGPITYSSASAIPVAEEPSKADADLSHFLSAIHAQARLVLQGQMDGITPSALNLLSYLTGQCSMVTLQAMHFSVANVPKDDVRLQLVHFALACRAAESMEGLNNLAYYLNAIQFASLCNHYLVTHHGQSIADIFRLINKWNPNLKPPSLRTLFSIGTVACRIAGAGSLYMLVLVSCARVKSLLGKMSVFTVGVLSRFIRFPTDSKNGWMIKGDIINAISKLREQFPLDITLFFNKEFLLERYQYQSINCTDLIATDKFFDHLSIYNDFIKVRDWDAWGSCLWPVGTPCYTLDLLDAATAAPSVAEPSLSNSSHFIQQQPTPPPDFLSSTTAAQSVPHPDWNRPMVLENLMTIRVDFDFNAEDNKKSKFPSQALPCFMYTEEQRRSAAGAYQPTTLKEFATYFQSTFFNGVRYNPDHWTYLSADISRNQRIRLDGKDGKFMAYIDATMKQDMRDFLLPALNSVFDNIHHVDSEAEGSKHQFTAINARIFYKFAKKGHGTPTHADPTTLQRDGRRPVSTSLNVPRLGKDVYDFSQLYHRLNELLKPVFEWIEELLRELLPDSFDKLETFISFLPNGATSPVYPFGGYIININVTTRIHRDLGDQDICLVLVISDCKGGELCLQEPGLVLDLQNGDVIIFASSDLSHFNMHYSGKRASIVLHSDKTAQGWVNDCNGWAPNVYFRTSIGNDDDYRTCNLDSDDEQL